MKKKTGVKIACAFTDHFFYAFAGSPPAVGIILTILNRDNAYMHVIAKRLLKKQPTASGVNPHGYEIKAGYRKTMLFDPLPQRNRGGIAPITILRGRRHRLNEFRVHPQPDKPFRGIGGLIIACLHVHSGQDIAAYRKDKTVRL